MRSIYFSTLCLLMISAGCKAQNSSTRVQVDNKDSAVFNKICSLDFAKYVDNQTVGSFLSDIGTNYTSYTFGTVRSNYLRFVYFVYSDEMWVEVKVNSFKYVESYNTFNTWNIEEFKKEQIGAIRFVYKGQFIKSTAWKR